jgi:hypothetical protein
MAIKGKDQLMKKNPVNKIVSALVIVFGLVAIFVMYSACFAGAGTGASQLSSSYGSCFDVMFSTGLSDNNPVIPVMIVGFVALVVGVLLAFAGFVLERKQMIILMLVLAILFIANAVIFLFAVDLWQAVTGSSLGNTRDNALGSGSICTIVFSFLAAATSLVGVYYNVKNAD